MRTMWVITFCIWLFFIFWHCLRGTKRFHRSLLPVAVLSLLCLDDQLSLITDMLRAALGQNRHWPAGSAVEIIFRWAPLVIAAVMTVSTPLFLEKPRARAILAIAFLSPVAIIHGLIGIEPVGVHDSFQRLTAIDYPTVVNNAGWVAVLLSIVIFGLKPPALAATPVQPEPAMP